MKFARFTSFSFLSNFGFYNPQEISILEKEGKVAKLLQDNKWLVQVPLAKPFITRFLTIQTNNSVCAENIPSLNIELDGMIEAFEAMASASPTFENHQPDALVFELISHLATRKMARNNVIERNTAKVISYKADLRNHNAENFHAMLQRGQKVLWALDVDGYLSIGDPQGNKHSVVAAGKVVKGAGIAQIKMCDRTDLYWSMKDTTSRASELERRAVATSNGKEKTELLDVAEHLRLQADDFRNVLRGFIPPLDIQRIIELDFDSGHYAPREAWKASTAAWNEAGYIVEWSKTAKFV